MGAYYASFVNGVKRGTMSDIELAIIHLLAGRTKGNALSRDAMVYEVGLLVDRRSNVSDRAIREAIETLRQTSVRGARIMSSSGWSGYWMLDHIDEFEAFYQEEKAAIHNRLGRLEKQRDLLVKNYEVGQFRMFA